MATTYNNLYLDTRTRLKKAGIEGGQLEARELICYAADKSREQFYRDMHLYASGELEKRVDALVQRRLGGEPVAYIVGEWEFYGLPLNVSSEVLIPRIDTEVLAERGILDTRTRLKKAGIEGGQLEARELICYAADKSREQFYRDMHLYASGELEKRVDALVQRRLGGEPVAYIVGEWEFYGLPLNVSSEVLIPRIDTEVLAERGILKARAAGEGARVLDLCAGSGCVGLAIAANAPGCRVVLGELAEGALRVCKQNVRRNELNARVTCLSVDAMEPPSSALWDFDVIVSNPPYIPTGDIPGLDPSVRDYEPLIALDGGADGLDFYRFIASKWKNALRLGGTLLFEVGIGQAPEVEEILAQNGFEQIQTTADTQGIWRVVEGTING